MYINIYAFEAESEIRTLHPRLILLLFIFIPFVAKVIINLKKVTDGVTDDKMESIENHTNNITFFSIRMYPKLGMRIDVILLND